MERNAEEVYLLVEKLRSQFLGRGVTISDCLLELKKADYDLEKAKQSLTQKLSVTEKEGKQVPVDKFSSTKEGIAYVKVNHKGDSAVIFKVACLTDFASGSSEFVKFVDEIADILLENRDVWKKHQDSHFDYLTLQNKQGETISSLVQRKQKVFGRTEELRVEKVNALSLQEGCVFGHYLHANGSFAALVEVNSTPERAQKLALHVAAMRPEFISLAKTPQEVLRVKENELTEKAKLIATKKGKQTDI
jgi:elongation factor Ts